MNRLVLSNKRSLPFAALKMSRMSSSQSPTKPKAVIFDMGGVVVPSPLPYFTKYEEMHRIPRNELTALVLSGHGTGIIVSYILLVTLFVYLRRA